MEMVISSFCVQLDNAQVSLARVLSNHVMLLFQSPDQFSLREIQCSDAVTKLWLQLDHNHHLPWHQRTPCTSTHHYRMSKVLPSHSCWICQGKQRLATPSFDLFLLACLKSHLLDFSPLLQLSFLATHPLHPDQAHHSTGANRRWLDLLSFQAATCSWLQQGY